MINIVAKKAYERKGSYYYYFPTLNQGRKILWDGMDRGGFKFLDHFPKEIIANKSEQSMQLKLKNGSIFQIMGTDKVEVVGPNPVGCVFSEYSLQNPSAWDYVRPILVENGGWAIFNFTPRGMNHGYNLFHRALGNPRWFTQLLTVDDTGAVSLDKIEQERQDGMSEELISQEFYCSWEYGLEGAYYLKQMAKARKEGRICALPILDKPVFTAWDIGLRDSNAIWFWQEDGPWLNVIDYYEASGEYIAHYAKTLKDKPYMYARHFAPHDAAQDRIHARSVATVARSECGLDLHVLPKEPSVLAGIEVVRSVFPKCRFDQARCEKGLNALMNYQKEFNEERRCFSEHPLHNWASDGADAFRMFARAVSEHRTVDDQDPMPDDFIPQHIGYYSYGRPTEH